MRALLVLIAAAPVFAASCEELKLLTIPDVTITAAVSFAAGGYAPPVQAGANTAQAPSYTDLPAFCRVTAELKPSTDSDILMEVWMPVENWNGKLEGNGNGGWTGSINPATLAAGLRRNYATAMSDTGHEGGSGNFALTHPEKLTDFAYRSTHAMTVNSKVIVKAFYGKEPGLSYFVGCSAGGKQGLTEAQLFPTDYNGIIAGAPANNWTHMMAQIIWAAQAVHKNETDFIGPEKLPALHNAAIEACDAKDGVKDGVIDDPTKCKFDPKEILCKGKTDGSWCLTAPQVEAARKIYSPLRNPRTKEEIYPGFEPGSELNWAQYVAGPTPTNFATDLFKYVVFKDPTWDYKTLNFDSDIALADKIDKGANNATDPNLNDFFGHGGKLIQYHGWADQLIAPENSPNYYMSVLKAVGAKADDAYRLFMVPGMNHCQGGEGATDFDMLTALEQWVEQGQAPDRVMASHATKGKVDRTRPLCPYPQSAVYNGKGSTDDAQNFTCKVR